MNWRRSLTAALLALSWYSASLAIEGIWPAGDSRWWAVTAMLVILALGLNWRRIYEWGRGRLAIMRQRGDEGAKSPVSPRLARWMEGVRVVLALFLVLAFIPTAIAKFAPFAQRPILGLLYPLMGIAVMFDPLYRLFFTKQRLAFVDMFRLAVGSMMISMLPFIGATIDLARVAGKAPSAVLNAAPVRNPLVDEAREAIARYGIALAPAVVHQRLDHVHAFTAGLAAPELAPRSKAAAEVNALFTWMSNGALSFEQSEEA